MRAVFPALHIAGRVPGRSVGPSVIGGLGSAIAELLSKAFHQKVAVKHFGIPSRFSPRVGSQHYLVQENGLSAAAIIAGISSVPAGRAAGGGSH